MRYREWSDSDSSDNDSENSYEYDEYDEDDEYEEENDEEESDEEESDEEESDEDEESSEDEDDDINTSNILDDDNSNYLFNRSKRNIAQIESYEIISDDEEYIENLIEKNDNIDNDDDDYAPEISDGLDTDINHHPHCPTILYMYKVYNWNKTYLKVGIARIPEEYCCMEIENTRERKRIRNEKEEWFVKWDRENAKKYVNSTLDNRIRNEKNSLENGSDYEFNVYNYKYVKLYPTLNAAKKNEKIIIDMMEEIENIIPIPAIRGRAIDGRNGSKKREFFNHPKTLYLNSYEKDIWNQIKNIFR